MGLGPLHRRDREGEQGAQIEQSESETEAKRRLASPNPLRSLVFILVVYAATTLHTITLNSAIPAIPQLR